MTHLAEVVQLPRIDIQDVPNTLRNLADNIEAGDFGEVVSLAWVLKSANHSIQPGFIGASQSPQADGYLLFNMALRELEKITVPTRGA
jgi:hypothetical protein